MIQVISLVPIFIFFALIIFGAIVSAVVRKLSGWNKTYTEVAKRYGGHVFHAYMFSRPSMTFDYGRTFCKVGNRKSSLFPEGRMTELAMKWADPKFKLDISTSARNQAASRIRFFERPPKETLEESGLDSRLTVKTNRIDMASKMLTPAVKWQIEQLLKLANNAQLAISIQRGRLLVSKPTYLKKLNDLDDFVRHSLDLFDQLMLIDCQGIEFVARNEPVVVEDVVCPICSEKIEFQTVVCVRCKTPHCLDCWQYNGQCATFACNEKRYIKTDGTVVSS